MLTDKINAHRMTHTGDTKSKIFMAYNTQGSQKPRLVFSASLSACSNNLQWMRVPFRGSQRLLSAFSPQNLEISNGFIGGALIIRKTISPNCVQKIEWNSIGVKQLVSIEHNV